MVFGEAAFDGEFMVFALGILEAGKVSLTDAKGEHHEFVIKGGFTENHDNQLTICVEL